MGNAHSLNVNKFTEFDDELRSFSPPDQFKFSKLQRLKLTVIQAALAPKESMIIQEITSQESSIDSNPSQLKRSLSSTSSFNISDPQESFISTVSALITLLNRVAFTVNETYDENFWKHLQDLLRLFTSVFVKNTNIKGIAEVFEFEIDDGKVISEHLLTSYINIISMHLHIPNSILEEVLRSFLILISSNLHFSQKQGRYFHEFLVKKLSSDHLINLFNSLTEISCTFTFKTNGLGFLGSIPIISDKSRSSSQILVAILLSDKNHLDSLNDLKLFSLFIKFQSQVFQYSFPNNLNLNDLTVLTIFSNFLTNFCSNYRRFLLSKLDNEELVKTNFICFKFIYVSVYVFAFVSLYIQSLSFNIYFSFSSLSIRSRTLLQLISICKVIYFLMKGKMNKKQISSFNMYMLTEILVSFSEDGTFIKQIFESDLDNSLVKWYEGELGTTTSLGGFIFFLLIDVLGANLAPNDGLKDEYLHELLTSTLSNFSQYLHRTDNECLSERFWAIFNGLFSYISIEVDSVASKCLIDILIILSNILINNPRDNSILISHFIIDKERLTLFLREYLCFIDSKTNSKLSAHLNESELEFITILIGILRFFEKLSKHLETLEVDGISLLATFPIPTFRRDSRGEVNRLGSKFKIIKPINRQIWATFVSEQIWLIIYSTIPWNKYVE